MTKTVPIVIPSYEPDERLIALLKDLEESGLGPVIIVNDGSGTEYDEIFSEAEKLIEANGGKYIAYRPNKGKEELSRQHSNTLRRTCRTRSAA